MNSQLDPDSPTPLLPLMLKMGIWCRMHCFYDEFNFIRVYFLIVTFIFILQARSNTGGAGCEDISMSLPPPSTFKNDACYVPVLLPVYISVINVWYLTMVAQKGNFTLFCLNGSLSINENSMSLLTIKTSNWYNI